MQELEKIHVLIADDSATVRNTVSKHLGDAYFSIHAADGQEAWQLIQSNNSISLVFADINMPNVNGMVLLQQIRSSDDEYIANLPVIMITGHEDSEAAKQASHTMGATDFISKPFSALDIISRAGSYTKLNQRISTLEQNLSYDSLTKLLNKPGLQEPGDKAISGSYRHQFDLSILFMQINNTDEVQSKFGKGVFEQIIVSTAKNIKRSLRNEDILAHFGAGKFVVLLPMTKAFKAHILALRIQDAIDNLAYELEDSTIRVKLAAGLNSTEGRSDPVTFAELSLQAEKALQVSLQHRGCKIVRKDELLSNKQHAETHEQVPADVESQQSSRHNCSSTADAKKPDMKNFSNHMSAILYGDYEKIPAEDVENMIKPLESFLDYAYKQTKTGMDKNKQNT